MDTDQGREQNVDLTRFDFLDGADIQVNEFCEPFLRETFAGPFAANTCAELFKLRLDFLADCHAPLSRQNAFDLNGLLGRNMKRGSMIVSESKG